MRFSQVNCNYGSRIRPNRCIRILLLLSLPTIVFVFLGMAFLAIRLLICSDEIPFSKFQYPIDTDMKRLVKLYKEHKDTGYKPINLYPFKYIHSQNTCSEAKEVFILFLIRSEPDHFENRQAIRDTWTNGTYFKNLSIRHVFLIGKSHYESTKILLYEENKRYRDFVELSFIDDYYNLTYKTIGGLNWAVEYCSNARFVMLVDDDYFVATDGLIQHLQRVPNDNLHQFFCGNVVNDRPPRDINNKWYMPIYDYPFDKYPLFISGGAIVMSIEFVIDLQIAIKFTRLFKYEDVFLAIVAYKLGVKPVHMAMFETYMRKPYTTSTFQNSTAVHLFGNTTYLRKAWQIRVEFAKNRKRSSSDTLFNLK